MATRRWNILHSLQAELRQRGVSSNVHDHEILPAHLHLTGDGFSAVDEELTMMPGIEVQLLDDRGDDPRRFATIKAAADYIDTGRLKAKKTKG